MAENGNNSGLLKVRLVTPDRVLLDATASAVELPSMSGYLEALYGAAPLLAELGAGQVKLHGGTAGEQVFFVAWGFVEVLPERVTILAETALHPEEIDPAQAQRELAQAQELWNQAGDDQVKYDEANAAERVAEEKLAAAHGGKQASH
jgi:F-type H+-transporting ATPase subunit epsilon